MPTRGTFPIRGKVPTRQNAWSDGRFIERTLRINFIERIKVPIFRCSFINADNAWAPTQLSRERHPQHFESWFFIEGRPINFYIDSTRAIQMIMWKNWGLPALKLTSDFLLLHFKDFTNNRKRTSRMVVISHKTLLNILKHSDQQSGKQDFFKYIMKKSAR